MGVANDHSIAWGIAQALAANGAEVALTYQDENFEKRVRPLAKTIGSSLILPCDVSDQDSIDAAFETIATEWGGLDFVVHAIAFSDKSELNGRFFDYGGDTGCCRIDANRRQRADADLCRRSPGHAEL